jgi:hypothetical protein
VLARVVSDRAGSRRTHAQTIQSRPTVSDLTTIYRELEGRCRTPDGLAAGYRRAYARGESDLAASEPNPGPVGLLATAVPRLVSLAVATYAVHILPWHAPLAEELLATVDQSATGSLRRCHLALDADGRDRGYAADEWLPVIYDVAHDALRRASVTDDPPAVVHLSQEASRWVAVAIDALDQNDSTVTDSLADALGRLLVVCMFADAALTHSAATRP